MELAQNQLTGEIPEAIGELTNLGRLYLEQNHLTGELPAAIGKLANLRSLELAQNQLTGEIPEAIAELTNLSVLHVLGNDLTGCLPLALSRLDNLHVDDKSLSFCLAQDDSPMTVSSPSALTAIEGGTLLIEKALLLENDVEPGESYPRIIEVGDPINGTVSMKETSITFVHDGSETTTGAFVYTVSDGMDTATVTIAVRPVNDPPAAADDAAVMDEGETLLLEESVLLFNDSDAEGDALNISAVGEPVNGTVRLDGTTIIFVHDGSETTTGAFAYTVSDGVETATATVTVAISPVNDSPNATDDIATVGEGETLLLEESVLLFNDSDAEGDTLNISALGEPVNGTVRLDGTTIIFVHDGSETTTGAFAYTVSDGVETATATVTIAISPVNDPPNATDDIATVGEGETLLLEESVLLFNDSDAESSLMLSGVGNAINGTVGMDGTTITYVHDGSETTSGAFMYTVTDGVETTIATVTITVRPVNDPPTAVGDTAVVDQGETLLMEQLVLLLNDSDPEGEMLSILAVRDAANGKVRMDGTTITYVHDGSETSTGGFAYAVSDGVVTTTATVTITIRGVNEAPTANSDTALMDEGETLQIQTAELLLNDVDAEGEALRISAVGDAVNGSVSMDGSTITFVHDGSETSSGGFTYTVSDGVATSAASVAITVRPVNDLPVVQLMLLALGVVLVTVVILALSIVLRRSRRVSQES